MNDIIQNLLFALYNELNGDMGACAKYRHLANKALHQYNIDNALQSTTTRKFRLPLGRSIDTGDPQLNLGDVIIITSRVFMGQLNPFPAVLIQINDTYHGKQYIFECGEVYAKLGQLKYLANEMIEL